MEDAFVSDIEKQLFYLWYFNRDEVERDNFMLSDFFEDRHEIFVGYDIIENSYYLPDNYNVSFFSEAVLPTEEEWCKKVNEWVYSDVVLERYVAAVSGLTSNDGIIFLALNDVEDKVKYTALLNEKCPEWARQLADLAL